MVTSLGKWLPLNRRMRGGAHLQGTRPVVPVRPQTVTSAW